MGSDSCRCLGVDINGGVRTWQIEVRGEQEPLHRVAGAAVSSGLRVNIHCIIAFHSLSCSLLRARSLSLARALSLSLSLSLSFSLSLSLSLSLSRALLPPSTTFAAPLSLYAV